jgi:flagellar protein FlgJ
MSASASTFIARIAPIAVQLRIEGSPIFPSVRIAQSGLETGWKIPAWNNLGGYKVGSGKLTPYWRGKIVNKGTWEVYDGKRVDVTAAFRAYDSVEDFFRDQDLLFANTRYARVRSARTPEEQADMLQACGYATDPQYAAKLKNIMRTYGLSRYDEEVERVLQELQKKITALEKKVAELEKKQEPVPAPAWFVREFGSADLGGLINDPDGKKLPETWEAIALAARMAGIGKK